MKQEALNTFSEGLNYDLNPLVTPNNVLTDNVNGTFITFNGNELSLQNDAGNTLINVKSVDRIFTYNNTVSYRAATIGIQDPEDPGYHPKADKIAYTIAGEEMRCYICVADTEPGESPVTHPNKWREYVVRLSPGFYPLAMKEYGGVLYIVSGRDVIRLATTYIPGTYYALDDFVNTGLTTIPIKYYKSLKYNNNAPLTDPTAWEYMGNGRELDKIRNDYNEIEFGSYPSPEIYGEEGSDPWDTLVDENQIGYPKIIGDIVFKPGTAVSFTQYFLENPEFHLLEIDWITRYHGPNTFEDPHERFYIAKLHQQLTSGYVDLTESVEYFFDKWYNNPKNTTPEIHWLIDPAFKYYCPFLYKGKLAISLDIRDLIRFDVVIIAVSLDEKTRTFRVELRAEIEFLYNPWTIWVNPNDLSVKISEIIGGWDISILNHSSEPQWPLDTENLTETVHQTFTYDIIISNISIDNYGETMKYEITPFFDWEGASALENGVNKIGNEYLPQEYLDEHTRIGSVILLADAYTTKFSLELAKTMFSAYNVCEIDNGFPTGYRIYNVLPLVNGADELINTFLEPSTTPYVFVNDANYAGYVGTLPYGAEIVGTYTIDSDTNRAIFASWKMSIDSNYQALIKAALSTMIVRIEDPSCLYVDLTITIDDYYLVTSPDENIITIVYQQGNQIGSFRGKTGIIKVMPGVLITVQVTTINVNNWSALPMFEFLDYKLTITENKSINLGLIAQLYFAETGSGNNDFILIWPCSAVLSEPYFVVYNNVGRPIEGLLSNFAFKGKDITVFKTPPTYLEYHFDHILEPLEFFKYDFNSNIPVVGYDNINNTLGNYISIASITFRTQSTGTIEMVGYSATQS